MKLRTVSVENGMTMGKGIVAISVCVLLVAVFAPQADAGVATAVVVGPPGPTTLVLLGTGLLGLGGAVRRRIWRG